MDRNDDIMNPGNGFKKVKGDVEDLGNSRRLSSMNLNEDRNSEEVNADETSDDDDIEMVKGTEADVTREDLIVLGDAENDRDSEEEGVQLRSRVDRVDAEDDLDIPGADLDDESEAIGEEDEENNYYSLGGDRHESLEDDPVGSDDNDK